MARRTARDIDLRKRSHRQALRTLRCQRSLHYFIQQAWPIVYPGKPFIDNWHIEALCRHLQEVSQGKWKRLAINVPVRTSKSSVVSVFWPAWQWTFDPAHQFLSVTNEGGLATRDTRRMRLLVQSEWFLRHWDMTFARDQNQRTYFENDDRGHRQGLGVTANVQGKDCDTAILDDVLDREAAMSSTERSKICEIIEESVLTRFNDPGSGAAVAIGQRTHQQDHFGHIYEEGGWDRLVIPMEYEPDHPFPSTTGFVDPRDEPGEPLCLARFPHHVLEREKRYPFKWAGQYQQRPSPKGGGMFQWDWFPIVDGPPARACRVRHWDLAATSGGGDFTVGVLQSKVVLPSPAEGVPPTVIYTIEDAVIGQWPSHERDERILAIARSDGKGVRIGLEQEGGSGGKSQAESISRRLRGYSVVIRHTSGRGKELRADPVASEAGAGNYRVVRASWNNRVLDELTTFPAAAHDDVVDAISGGYEILQEMGDGWLWSPKVDDEAIGNLAEKFESAAMAGVAAALRG